MASTTKKVFLPDLKNWVILRESNGADEEILTRVDNSKTGEMIHLFLAAVIVDSSLPRTSDDISLWKSNNKYYAYLQARIFSIGNILRFPFQFDNEKNPNFYRQDLNEYIWDLDPEALATKPIPKFGEEGYSLLRIVPYPQGDQDVIEMTLKTGRKIQWHILDGIGEKMVLNKNVDALSKNDVFRTRRVSYFGDKEAMKTWIPVSDFRIFSSLEQMEIRISIKQNDPSFDMRTEITNPTGETTAQSVIQISSFFSPEEEQC